MLPFEFLITRRPVSLQTPNKKNLQDWKNFVNSEVQRKWKFPVMEDRDFHVSIVWLCEKSTQKEPDVDNIVKPILDALNKLVYEDDILVTDVESHRRYLADGIDVTDLPFLLQQAVYDGKECVYVRIEDSKSLESYL